MAYNEAVPRFTRLPLLIQTAYARVLDGLLTSEVGDVEAGTTLVSKVIAGHRYWYAQRYLDGKKVQSYIGRESPALLETLERWRRARKEGESRAQLIAAAVAGGAYAVSAAEARVLELLAPVFRRGAVLVGSHAFAVIGTAMGVRWEDAMVRTDDVDVAHDPRIAVAVGPELEPISFPATLGDAIPRFDVLNPTSPATTFRVRGTEIEVDLLTPMIGREIRKPVRIPALGAAAIPLRFLDYLIEESQPGAIIGGAGALVRVPRPGRYAMHKLIIAGRRHALSAKPPKDRTQAAALIELLDEELPGEIEVAWNAVKERGRNWITGVRESVARLDPDVITRLKAHGIEPIAPRQK
jgi:hypothetical protein